MLNFKTEGLNIYSQPTSIIPPFSDTVKNIYQQLCSNDTNARIDLPFRDGDLVRFTKLSEVRFGFLPVGYWCDAVLTSNIESGFCCETNRIRRMGSKDMSEENIVNRPGEFHTSKVLNIEHVTPNKIVITTLNSTWQVERLDIDGNVRT